MNTLFALPDARLYVLCALTLVMKMFFVSAYTGFVRSRRRVTVFAEDARGRETQVADAEHPDVRRVQRAHQNDLENIPIFLVLALAAVLAQVAPTPLAVCLVGFTVARVGHTVSFLRGAQPWRSMSYGFGFLATLVVMALLVARMV